MLTAFGEVLYLNLRIAKTPGLALGQLICDVPVNSTRAPGTRVFEDDTRYFLCALAKVIFASVSKSKSN